MRLLYVSRFKGTHDKRFVEAWNSVGFEVLELQLENDSKELLELFKVTIESYKPDLIQVGPLTTPGSLVANNWDGPLIVASWGFDLLDEAQVSTSHKIQVANVLSKADLIFSDNEVVTAEAINVGAPKELIVEFPWGLEPDWLQLPRSTFEKSRKIKFLCTRHHDQMYRVEDVLQGFASSTISKLGGELYLVGEGPMTAALKNLSRKLKLEHKVHFLGRQSPVKLRQIFLESDVYISSSRTDGSSISLLEAMAAGLPVLTSNIPGNMQWIKPESGWLFEVGDTTEISALMDMFIEPSNGLLSEINARIYKSRTLVEEKANWNKTVSDFSKFAKLAVENNLKFKENM